MFFSSRIPCLFAVSFPVASDFVIKIYKITIKNHTFFKIFAIAIMGEKGYYNMEQMIHAICFHLLARNRKAIQPIKHRKNL
jgi:hypothetical protein